MSYHSREEAIKRSIELRKIFSAPADDTCEVEFFFYTDKIDRARDLTNKIKTMHYFVECVPSSGDKDTFLITGNTQRMNMQTKEMLEWMNQMNDLANEFECDFDGWGALIENKDSLSEKRVMHHL